MKGVSKLRRRGGRMEWKERKEGSEILERERERERARKSFQLAFIYNEIYLA